MRRERTNGSFKSHNQQTSHIEKDGSLRFVKNACLDDQSSLSRSNYKSVPILFEKQRVCICNKEHKETNQPEVDNDDLTPKNTITKLHQHKNAPNTLTLDNNIQTQCKLCGSFSSFSNNNNIRNEINEVTKKYSFFFQN